MNSSLTSPPCGYTHLQRPKDLLSSLRRVLTATLGDEPAQGLADGNGAQTAIRFLERHERSTCNVGGERGWGQSCDQVVGEFRQGSERVTASRLVGAAHHVLKNWGRVP